MALATTRLSLEYWSIVPGRRRGTYPICHLSRTVMRVSPSENGKARFIGGENLIEFQNNGFPVLFAGVLGGGCDSE